MGRNYLCVTGCIHLVFLSSINVSFDDDDNDEDDDDDDDNDSPSVCSMFS